jgi:hypothetical protein
LDENLFERKEQIVKGRNEFIFCEAQMKEALQYYFDNVFLKDQEYEIKSINQSNSIQSNGFKITLEEKKKIKDAKVYEEYSKSQGMAGLGDV